jgi:4-hydroxy-tetrahydrodipicolinate synthase
VAVIVSDLSAAGIALPEAHRPDAGGNGALGPRADADLGAEVAYR